MEIFLFPEIFHAAPELLGFPVAVLTRVANS